MHDAVDDVALPDEIGNKGITRLIVDILRCANLQNVAVSHDHHTVGHGERFLLIVGDIDEGDLQSLLNTL